MSRFSQRVRDKYLGDKTKFLNRAESEFSRRFLEYSAYMNGEIERCADAGAHLAVGVLSMSLIEGMLTSQILGRKEEVSKARTFAKCLASYSKSIKQGAKSHPRPSYIRVVCSLRADELYRIAREIALIDIETVPADCLTVLSAYGYPRDIAGVYKFLQDIRNSVHLNSFARRIDAILPARGIDPRKSLGDLHYDFALVSSRIRQILGSLPSDRNLLIRPF